MNPTALTREEASNRLISDEAQIRAFGVRRLALFGSVLRGDARPESDVDLLVEFGVGQKTFEHFMGLALFLEELLERRVEIVTPELIAGMRDHLIHGYFSVDYDVVWDTASRKVMELERQIQKIIEEGRFPVGVLTVEMKLTPSAII